MMKKLVFIFIISSLFIYSCDSDNDSIEESTSEIELLFPVQEQGEIVNIPINTPIQFQAKLSNDEPGEIIWWLEEDRVHRNLNDFYTFSKNGLFKVNFYCHLNNENKDQTFIWVNVVGKVVTDIANDEVGCAIAENQNGIYIVTKNRESYTRDGAFVYRYADNKVVESKYVDGVGQIKDLEKFDNGDILMINTTGELRMSSTEEILFEHTESPYSEYHLVKNEDGSVTGIGVNQARTNVYQEKRDFNGTVIKKEKITRSGDKNINDAYQVNDSICMVIYPDYWEEQLELKTINILNKKEQESDLYDLIQVRWKDARFNKITNGVLIYPTEMEFDYHFVRMDKQLNNIRRERFENLDYTDDSYYCGEYDEYSECHDKKVWGWESDDFFNFMTQNNKLRINKEYNWKEPISIFNSTSQIKVDWVFKSDDSILILTNTKKYNEFGFYSKRFCTIYRMNLKGEFIDL